MRPFLCRPLCRSRPVLLAACLGLSLGAPLLAAQPQAPTTENLRQQQQQQRDLQQLQLEQRQRQLERGAFGSAAETVEPVTPARDDQCWPLRGTRIGGVTLLDNAILQAQLRPLIAPCMGVNQINRLLGTITRLYVEAGYIASRPYLSSPPAAGQSLDILIEEGFVESIELADQSLPLSLRGAFPGMLGKPLNLRDLEQGLDQLNRLRAFDLTADIAPGSLPGGSRIIIRPRALVKRWGLELGLDNLGSASTGRDRTTLSLGLDSPLGLNDYLNLSLSDTLNGDARFSRSQSLYYGVPYGYWSLALFASRAEYWAPVRLSQRTVDSEGRTDQLSLRLDRVLWRGQRHQLSGNLQLAHKRVESLFLNQRLEIQSPTLTVAEAGISLFWLDSATWSVDLGYAQGLTWFGADRDDERRFDDLPRPQFRKWRAGLGQWRNGLFGAQPWQWHSQLSLQYSPDPLPAIEQVLASDDSAVRGFRRNAASGASAAIWRNTLRLPQPLEHGLLLTPRLGLDGGWVKADHGSAAQRLAGASTGLSLNWRALQLDLDYQRSLHSPRTFIHEPEIWLMRLSLSL
ncbi:ShlB/FhaC/HecB family hemolysin secretion/activation protein [Pseudomonas benzenivorans]|uniref:ShlB/FhaC/HecB family hemolysin secretion/activation protein n=1 Tax=Pseudomonas benzenivorans TaxID=556533 RepID=A0ABZ0PU93_9PSED|nr:ShlB/FhaC/HecB family hemolysin secretion/activation protein [Pseudomonas benzenivorans]WPC04752.1 ShlB/FhaC/HecB family hemolysin secretion/activation protein [Pseudomonas benzenivorans]